MRFAPLTFLAEDVGPDELQLANIRRLARHAAPKPPQSVDALESTIEDLKRHLTAARHELRHKDQIITHLRQEIVRAARAAAVAPIRIGETIRTA